MTALGRAYHSGRQNGQRHGAKLSSHSSIVLTSTSPRRRKEGHGRIALRIVQEGKLEHGDRNEDYPPCGQQTADTPGGTPAADADEQQDEERYRRYGDIDRQKSTPIGSVRPAMQRSDRGRARSAHNRPRQKQHCRDVVGQRDHAARQRSLVAVSVKQTTTNRVQRRPGNRRPTIHPRAGRARAGPNRKGAAASRSAAAWRVRSPKAGSSSVATE